jgi:hypothetical protein
MSRLVRVNSRDSRAQTLVFIRVNSRFPFAQKSLKKGEKKACQPLAPSAKRGFDGTNRPRKPFKKTLKKVKKKLVSALKI